MFKITTKTSHFLRTKDKDFEKLFPWNIKITEFHEEGTWKNDT